jgi:hypothetical protein
MGAGGSGGAGTVGPDGNVVPSSDPSVTVTLGKACVVVGNAQTMHVQTYPGALLSYDTQYSGDKFGSTQGGKGSGQVDSTGSFDASWTVLPGTPNGVARIDVAANAGPNMSGFGHATFTVASSC